MTKKNSKPKGKPGKKQFLIPFLIVGLLAIPSLIMSQKHHPVVTATDAIIEQASEQGEAELIVRTRYARGVFNVLLTLNKDQIHCTVVVHKGTSYAMCDEPLGDFTFDSDGNLQS